MFDFDKKNNARNRDTIEKNKKNKNETNEKNKQKNKKKNEREQDEIQYNNFVLSNFDDDVKNLNLDKNNKILFNFREFVSLSISQFQSLIVLIDSQSQILLTNFQSQILQARFQSQILMTQNSNDEDMFDIL